MPSRGTIEGQVIISAKDLSGPAFHKAAANARGLDKVYASTNARMSRLSAGTAALGARSYAAIGGIAGVGLAVVKSVKEFSAWEAKLMDFGKITNITGNQLDAFGTRFIDLAPKVGQTNDKLLEAATTLAGKGLDVSRLDTALKDIGKTATATGSDITDISKTSFTLMDAMGIRAENIKDTFDALAQAGKLGSFELKDMAKELPYLAAQGKLLGMTGKEGATELAAMLQVAMKTAGTTEEAANNMANLFGKLKSSDTSKHLMKYLGVDVEKEWSEAERKGEDFSEHMIALISKMTKGDPFRIAEIFPDRQAQQAFLALSQYWDDYIRIRDRALKTHGVIDTDFDRTMALTEQKLQRFKNNIDRLFIAAGRGLTSGGVNSAIDEINTGLESIESKDFGDFIAREAKAAIVGLKDLKAELDFVANSPFWSAVTGFYNAIENYKKTTFTQKRFDDIKKDDERRLNTIADPNQSIMDQVLTPWSYIRRGIRDGKWDLPLDQIEKNAQKRRDQEKAIEMQQHLPPMKTTSPSTRQPLRNFTPIPGPYDNLPWGLDRNAYEKLRARTLRDSIESGAAAPRRGRPGGVDISGIDDAVDEFGYIDDHINAFVDKQAKKAFIDRTKKNIKALNAKKPKKIKPVKDYPTVERVTDNQIVRETREIFPASYSSIDYAKEARAEKIIPTREISVDSLFKKQESLTQQFDKRVEENSQSVQNQIDALRKRVEEKLHPTLSVQPPTYKAPIDQSQIESGFMRREINASQSNITAPNSQIILPEGLIDNLFKTKPPQPSFEPTTYKEPSFEPPTYKAPIDQSQIESGFMRREINASQSQIAAPNSQIILPEGMIDRLLNKPSGPFPKQLDFAPPVNRPLIDQSQIESGFMRKKTQDESVAQQPFKVEFPKELPPFSPDALNRALSGKVEAEVVKPVPVEVKHEGNATLDVRIRVDGAGRVIGVSRSGSIANTKINTGVDSTGSAPVNPFEGVAGR